MKGTKSKIAGFKRVLTMTVNDEWAPASTLADVPTLVRLGAAIDGFDYQDMAYPASGADMVFTDMDETTVHPYEIDEWHTDGESLIWVKLPRLKQGTQFKLAYGAPSTFNVQRSTSDKHEVWSGYAGVWHMNEDSGTAYDSTANGLDGIPTAGENGDIGQMIGADNVFCGKGRINATSGMEFPAYDGLGLGGSFIVSGFFHREVVEDEPPRLFARKHLWDSDDGWEISCGDWLHFRGASSSAVGVECAGAPQQVYVTCVVQGATVDVYTNGVFGVTGEIAETDDNARSLGVGRVFSEYDTRSFQGQYDEIRLRGGSLSADRIKVDYDMIAHPGFLNYGSVTNGAGTK